MNLIWLFYSASLWAQESGEAAEHAEHLAIPWWNIGVQAFNFCVFFGLLAYLLHKPIRNHFAQRALEYRELVERAETARAEAERSHNLIKDRMAKLELSAQSNADKARVEGEELRARLLQEAKGLSQKIEQDAQTAATAEVERAKSELRRDLLTRALQLSSETFKKTLGSSDQKKLQNEFVQKIEVVSG